MARQGHAGKEIVRCAEQRDADVIVVGHSGSGRASLVLGSTANHVIHHTTTPVVVVRGDRRDTPELVVVGADDHELDDHGENESVRALRWAYDIGDVRVIEVVHSWFTPSVVAGRFSNPGADFDDHDRAAIEVAERVIAAPAMPPTASRFELRHSVGHPSSHSSKRHARRISWSSVREAEVASPDSCSARPASTSPPTHTARSRSFADRDTHDGN